jgi:hypothetical protein
MIVGNLILQKSFANAKLFSYQTLKIISPERIRVRDVGLFLLPLRIGADVWRKNWSFFSVLFSPSRK